MAAQTISMNCGRMSGSVFLMWHFLIHANTSQRTQKNRCPIGGTATIRHDYFACHSQGRQLASAKERPGHRQAARLGISEEAITTAIEAHLFGAQAYLILRCEHGAPSAPDLHRFNGLIVERSCRSKRAIGCAVAEHAVGGTWPTWRMNVGFWPGTALTAPDK